MEKAPWPGKTRCGHGSRQIRVQRSQPVHKQCAASSVIPGVQEADNDVTGLEGRAFADETAGCAQAAAVIEFANSPVVSVLRAA